VIGLSVWLLDINTLCFDLNSISARKGQIAIILTLLLFCVQTVSAQILDRQSPIWRSAKFTLDSLNCGSVTSSSIT
jgi:hypothetical protein